MRSDMLYVPPLWEGAAPDELVRDLLAPKLTQTLWFGEGSGRPCGSVERQNDTDAVQDWDTVTLC